MGHESNGDIYCNWRTRNGPLRLGKETESVENWRTNRDHPNYSIVKIGQNTEKSPGDLKRVTDAHTRVKDYQQTLVLKTHKEYKNNKMSTAKILSVYIRHNREKNGRYSTSICQDYRIKTCLNLSTCNGICLIETDFFLNGGL